LRRVRAATQRIASGVEQARVASGHLKDFNKRYQSLRLQAHAEGRKFMTYSQAVRKLRTAVAAKAAANSGAAAKAETANLLDAVFGD
jgi:hypothetical protein